MRPLASGFRCDAEIRTEPRASDAASECRQERRTAAAAADARPAAAPAIRARLAALPFSPAPLMARLHPALILSPVLACAAALPAQARLMRIEPISRDLTQTAPLAGIGDVDADGFPDFAIGLAATDGFDGAVEVRSGRSGAVLATLRGDRGLGASFGVAIAGVGDVDRDGHADILVGMTRMPFGGDRPGGARLFSGRTFQALATVFGDGHGDLFGAAVAGIGDVDGDGVPDYAVGAPENGDPVPHYGPGYASIHSGADHRRLRRLRGVAIGDEYGSAIAGIGDLDRDGRADFMVGSLLEYRANGQGSARVYSGRDFRVLHAFFAEPGTDHFGVSLGSAGDVDGDGIADLMVGAIGMTSHLKGALWVYSGLDGSLLQTLRGGPASGVFAMGCAAAGDVDQDGFADLFVSDPMDGTAGPMAGAVHLFSGRTWQRLWSVHGPNPGSMYGRQFARVGDLDQDGLPELAVSTPMVALPRTTVARVDLLSTSGRVSTFGRGCATTMPPRLDATDPALGSTMTVLLASRPVPSPGVLLLGPVPNLPTRWVGDCTLYVDLATTVVAATFVTDGAGRFAAALPIPPNQAILDARFALQALVVATAGPQLYDVSNGVYATIGR
jgi:hypothetical protein